MKPAAFDYHRPETVPAMLGLLRDYGEDGKILAGGQSLVAAMNFRLARPSVLLDANRLSELSRVRVENGVLRIGAMARHAAFHSPVCDGPLGRLLARVVRFIAHYPIRQRGTFGGSLAHADPASEWCLAATVLDAQMVLRSADAERTVLAADFFRGTFTTALRPDELLTEIRIPVGDADARGGFHEFSRRAGDFALAMALVTLTIRDGRIAAARLGIGGVADRAVRLTAVERQLLGQAPSGSVFEEAGAAAAAAVDPTGDIHASPAFRRDLIRAMVTRALAEAAA